MSQRERNIPMYWTSHLKEKSEKEDLKNKVASAAEVLLVLKNKLELKKKHTKDDDFENAAWAFKRAYQDGWNAAMSEAQRLLP